MSSGALRAPQGSAERRAQRTLRSSPRSRHPFCPLPSGPTFHVEEDASPAPSRPAGQNVLVPCSELAEVGEPT
eukprot:9002577-Alexandrium_andersonii.AAC.1